MSIIAASLAWGGFVLTSTIGDPARGERVALAVLADDSARAEVRGPVTRAVMSVTGLPIDQTASVDTRVDQVLRDPSGASAFVDPFAGAWARMLGADDDRPARFDLRPVLDVVGVPLPEVVSSTLPVADVPLPDSPVPGIGTARRLLSTIVLPAALVAVAAFVAAFVTGERRRVLRRGAWWAIAAGAVWVVFPALLVFAASRWASGVDSVVGVAVAEGTAGVGTAALVMTVAGMVALAVSFVLPSDDSRPAPVRSRTGPPDPTVRPPDTVATTGTIPVTEATTRRPDEPRSPRPQPDRDQSRPRPPAAAVGDPSTNDRRRRVDGSGSQGDDLWDFYGSG